MQDKEKQESVEESFKSTIEDLVLISTKLKPFCESIQDLIGMLNLALENNGQLKLLINLVTAQEKQSKR